MPRAALVVPQRFFTHGQQAQGQCEEQALDAMAGSGESLRGAAQLL
jgi:hypothetical protein